MRALFATATIAAFIAGSSSATAQSLNSAIADFNTAALSGCYTGDDLGALLNLSNPLSLLGSIGYTETLADGTTRLRRQPMNLPSIVTEAASPDLTTCNLTLEATDSGSLNILGIAVQAERSNVFRIQARLITRQSLSTIVEDGQNIPVWESASYGNRFLSIINSRPSGSNFFLVDNMSVYLVTVERYRRSGFSGLGIFASFGGSASYKRDESFTGTRILVTGDTVSLSPHMFQQAASPITPPLVALPLEGGDSILSATALQQLERTLQSGQR